MRKHNLKLHNKGILKSDNKHVLGFTTLCVILFSIIAALLAYTRIISYEDGILEICAKQQDAYVQLVLDQINLKSNRDDEQIINEILSTMDASSNKYWTFSKNQSMLFIKDVLETNRYKGITAASYYSSDSAKAFLDNLQLDYVTHDNIMINGKVYIASGVSFEYKDEEYKLCLLTDKSVLLDNNSYLQIKIEMETFVVIILLALVVTSMIFAYTVKKLSIKNSLQDDTISSLNVMLSKMNDRLMEKDLHDTKDNVWEQNAIKPFMDRITERNITPVTFVHIRCTDVTYRDRFISKAVIMLDKNVLRFRYLESDIVLLCVQIDMNRTMKSINVLKDEHTMIDNVENIAGREDVLKIQKKYNLHDED